MQWCVRVSFSFAKIHPIFCVFFLIDAGNISNFHADIYFDWNLRYFNISSLTTKPTKIVFLLKQFLMKSRSHWIFRSKILPSLLLLAAAAILVIAHKLYSDRKSELKATIQNNLKAIAELKSDEIHTWLNERTSDVNVLTHINIYPDLSDFTHLKPDQNARLKERFKIVREHYNYEDVILLDHDKNLVLSTSEKLSAIGKDTKQYLEEGIRNKTTFKIYRSIANQQIVIDFFSPVKNEKNEVLGFLILRADPNEYLYPTIKRWPVVSKTAETNLVERSGDSIRSLNPTKYSPERVLKPQLSTKQTNNPGVNAVLGGSKLFEGMDYRNVPVLTYWVPIEGTEWKLIAKVDREELFDQIHYQAWVFGILISLLLLFMGSVLMLVRNMYQKSYIKKLYDAELERKMLVSHFDYLIKNANDIILLANDRGEIVEANDAAVRSYRIDRDDLLGSPLARLGEFGKRERNETAAKIYESVHYRSDGSSFPVEINEQIMVVEGRKYFQSIIRELTDRKDAEEKLRKSEALYKTILAA